MIRSTDEEPMTVGERYSGAINSSHLRLKERPGDIDLIVAAGLAGEDLASGLLRLHVEYDLVRSEHRASELAMQHREDEAKRQRGEVDGISAEDRAKILNDAAEAIALTAHVLILSQLPSLRSVKDALGAYVLERAGVARFMAPREYVLKLAGAVLDVHISPLCRHCGGRGFNGNIQRGERQAPCRPCKSSGSRRDSIGQDEADRAFVGALLMELNALVGKAEGDINRQKQTVRDAKTLIRLAEEQAR